MKYYIKKKEQLKIIKDSEISFFEISRFFYNNCYDNCYVVNEQGTLLDIWNAKNYLSKLNQSTKHSNHSTNIHNSFCSTSDINDYFLNNPDVFRKPIIQYNKIQGEYALSGYVGNSIIAKYNKYSIRWFVHFWQHISSYLKEQKIEKLLILCEKDDKETFLKLNGDFIIEVHDQYCPELESDSEYVINALFDDKARQENGSEKKGCNIYEITEAIVFKYTLAYLEKNKIQYVYAKGPDKHILTELNDDEIHALKYQSNPTALLENREYVNKVYKHTVSAFPVVYVIDNGLYYMPIDCNTHSINISNGIRKTKNTPHKASNNIHIYGPCIVQGFFVNDDETISSYLQQAYNSSQKPVKIWNHGINGMGSLLNSCIQILTTPLYENDVVIEINTCFELTNIIIENSNVFVIDLSELFKNKHYWFFNHPFHCNSDANRLIAQELKKRIHIGNKNTSKKTIMMLEKNHDISYVSTHMESYLDYLRKHEFNNTDLAVVSSIVMTADPFTNGHLELVKKALDESDYVYVFVVEEETGTFPFKDRYELVKKTLNCYKNIKVLRTDSTFHSTYTFPEYNLRGNEYSEQINNIPDLMIFGSIIAPTLNITKRYFGAEPYDIVTNQFNILAKNTLPNYGIEVVIIPRLEICGNIVSGTKIRELADLGEFTKLTELVPQTTLSYLKKTHNTKTSVLLSLIVNSKKVDVELLKNEVSTFLDSYEIIEYYHEDSIDYLNSIDQLINRCDGKYIAFINEALFNTKATELKTIIDSLTKKRSNITILRNGNSQSESSIVGKKILERIVAEKSTLKNECAEYFSFQNKIFEAMFLKNKCKCDLNKDCILTLYKNASKVTEYCLINITDTVVTNEHIRNTIEHFLLNSNDAELNQILNSFLER